MLKDSIIQLLNTNGWLDGTGSANLVYSWILVMIAAALICFLAGELTRNYSQTDKLWSMMPVVYGGITLTYVPSSPRLWIMTLLVTLWGLRLSYNFYRKGGYSIIPWQGAEDYRWGVLRQHPLLRARWKQTVFNLLFISFYQHLLILLFSSPLLLAAIHPEKKLSFLDFLAVFFMLLFIVIETIADNQLYQFHLQKKKKMAPTGKYTNSLSKGFMVEGLWNYVRHPNFAAEQAIWISFYFFGVAASGQWLNGTAAGPVLLVLLFAGSSEFTERISASKYPDYRIYKQTVPRFIPFPRKKKNPILSSS